MAAVAIKQHANGAMNRDKRAFFCSHTPGCVCGLNIYHHQQHDQLVTPLRTWKYRVEIFKLCVQVQHLGVCYKGERKNRHNEHYWIKEDLTVQTVNKLKRQTYLNFHNVSVLLLTMRQVF